MSGSVVDLHDNSLGLSDFGCVQINAHVTDGKVISVMHQLAKNQTRICRHLNEDVIDDT